jgi:hypothetical protein
MRDLLKSLAECSDVANLRSALNQLSAEFGEIAHMDILTVKRPGKRQALCLLQLESAAQERRLMANPGVTRFGSELLCVVDLPADQAEIAEQGSDRDRASRDDAVQRPENDPNENAGDRLFWFQPARWSGTLRVVARRALDRQIGWLGKRLIG